MLFPNGKVGSIHIPSGVTRTLTQPKVANESIMVLSLLDHVNSHSRHLSTSNLFCCRLSVIKIETCCYQINRFIQLRRNAHPPTAPSIEVSPDESFRHRRHRFSHGSGLVRVIPLRLMGDIIIINFIFPNGNCWAQTKEHPHST
jgi:hypothetical protein